MERILDKPTLLCGLSMYEMISLSLHLMALSPTKLPQSRQNHELRSGYYVLLHAYDVVAEQGLDVRTIYFKDQQRSWRCDPILNFCCCGYRNYGLRAI
jgi:hypothetical protein